MMCGDVEVIPHFCVSGTHLRPLLKAQMKNARLLQLMLLPNLTPELNR